MAGKPNPERQPSKLHRMTFNIPQEMAKEMIAICNEKGMAITSFGANSIEAAIKQYKIEKLQYLEVTSRLKSLEAAEKHLALTA